MRGLFARKEAVVSSATSSSSSTRSGQGLKAAAGIIASRYGLPSSTLILDEQIVGNVEFEHDIAVSVFVHVERPGRRDEHAIEFANLSVDVAAVRA